MTTPRVIRPRHSLNFSRLRSEAEAVGWARMGFERTFQSAGRRFIKKY